MLGVLNIAEYPTLTCTTGSEFLLTLVTDGVVEGPAQSLEEGMRRVRELTAEACRENIGLEEAADRVLAVAEAVGHIDDAAVLLVRCACAGPEGPEQVSPPFQAPGERDAARAT